MAITTATRVPSAKTYLEPGDATTCTAGVAIVYRRFVKVGTAGLGNHPKVIYATAGGPAYGVSHHNVASGGQLSVLRMGTYEVEAGENLTSGDEVMVGANGVAMKATATTQSGTTPFAVTFGGKPVGVCTADTTSGNGAPITLY